MVKAKYEIRADSLLVSYTQLPLIHEKAKLFYKKQGAFFCISFFVHILGTF